MTAGNLRNSYPLPLSRALRKFGADIKDARRRRRISVAVMAERASISRVTLNKIEKGDPGVSLGSYAMVLFILGFTYLDCYYSNKLHHTLRCNSAGGAVARGAKHSAWGINAGLNLMGSGLSLHVLFSYFALRRSP